MTTTAVVDEGVHQADLHLDLRLAVQQRVVDVGLVASTSSMPLLQAWDSVRHELDEGHFDPLGVLCIGAGEESAGRSWASLPARRPTEAPAMAAGASVRAFRTARRPCYRLVFVVLCHCLHPPRCVVPDYVRPMRPAPQTAV